MVGWIQWADVVCVCVCMCVWVWEKEVLTWCMVDVMPPNWHECPHWWQPNGNNQTIRADDSVGHVLDENLAVKYALMPRLNWLRSHSVRQTTIPTATRIQHVLWIPSNDDCQLVKRISNFQQRASEKRKRREERNKIIYNIFSVIN